MASNPIPNGYAPLIVQITKASDGATSIGADIPLLINTAALISSDRLALITAQEEFKAARAALSPLSATRKAAVNAAYDFCFTARDVIRYFCGREFNESWLAAGWTNSLEIPKDYDGLYALTLTLVGYLAANPTQENADLGVTSAKAQTALTNLTTSNTAILNQRALAQVKGQVRDEKMLAVRKRLSGLCKELSQRLGRHDPRWRQFGFNLPGAATVPAVPKNVSITPLTLARFQISCDASPNTTHYRFYYQRLIVDPVPVYAGYAADPLFVTESLAPGQEYLVYVSAVNDGAESELSTPVGARTQEAAAAA